MDNNLKELRESIDEVATLFGAFKTANDERLDKLENNEAFGEIEQKLVNIEKDLEEADKKAREEHALYKAMEERLNELEALYEAGGPQRSQIKALHEEHRVRGLAGGSHPGRAGRHRLPRRPVRRTGEGRNRP